MKMIRSVGKESPKTIMCLRCIVQRICLHTPNSRSKISSTSFSVYPRPARTESCPICISITQKRNSASDCKKKRAEDVRGVGSLVTRFRNGRTRRLFFRPAQQNPFLCTHPKNKAGCITFSSVIQPAFFLLCCGPHNHNH